MNFEIEPLKKEFANILNETLQEKLLSPPFKIKTGKDLVEDFKIRCIKYIDSINNLVETENTDDLVSEIKSKSNTIHRLYQTITSAMENFLAGNIKEAYDVFDQGLSETEISRIIFEISIPLSDLFDEKNKLYRVRKSDKPLKSRQDMFHLPFNKRHLVGAQRYSVAGLPCLYLGTSIFVCWLEMEKPDFDKLYISAFEPANKSNELNIIDFAYTIHSMFNFERNEILFNTETTDEFKKRTLARLVLLPLVIACNYIKSESNAHFNVEYIIPNLLMQWISRTKRDNVDGIMYKTTKMKNEVNSKIGINVIIPPKITYNDSISNNYCPRLASTFKLTNPVPWQVFRTLEFKDFDFYSDSESSIKKYKGIRNLDEALVKHYKATEFYKIERTINELMESNLISERYIKVS